VAVIVVVALEEDLVEDSEVDSAAVETVAVSEEEDLEAVDSSLEVETEVAEVDSAAVEEVVVASEEDQDSEVVQEP
jgi:hypothetical protein